MNTEDIRNGNMSDAMSQNAVSLYGQNDGVDDFPVLKAFQQYIDAEQEKARKRIVGLGIFFGAILVIVVAVFLFLLHGINMRNQTLSDRLVEYAMRESERRQPVVQSSSPNDAALKAVTETLASIQQKLANDNGQSAGGQNHAVEAQSAKLQKEKALLEEEKIKLAAEKERLRQIEIERQRRKLYPELYEDEYRSKRVKRSRKVELTDDDIREIINEAYPDNESATKHNSRYSADKSTVEKDSDSEDDDTAAIEYFKDDDYTIPVDIKGGSSRIKFTVPVD